MKLASKRWEVEVRPERGGRITSVRLDGEELLDQGIGVDQPTANGFVEGGAWGWDEMVPNLEATDKLPDHGEAWRLPWTVVAQSRDSLGLSCEGKLVPWRLGRRVLLDESLFAFYQYKNVGTEPHRAYWCGHPLFRYEPEMNVSIDVPRPDEGQSAKIFLPSGSIEQVQLRWRSGKEIVMSWDSFLTPEVAVWVCNGDLGGYRQIAVEPATASPVLEPGESLAWWLRITPL